ncbi:hypothetical protein EIP91_011266 [Steccherinum ochraceum]|uniref:Uncharacterized protein n=1 Tax=Steccherinum ochraceum TaxID=92696 RepID=A0A4R0QZV8_9APHY|nr:hypothetical protein EIP91_011266 [Steccherinum ochraceum]
MVTSSVFAAPLPPYLERLSRRGTNPRRADVLLSREPDTDLFARVYEPDNAIVPRYLMHIATPGGGYEQFTGGGGPDTTEVDEDVTGKVTKIIPNAVPGRRSVPAEGVDFAMKRALASRRLKTLEAIVKRVADEFDLD